MNTPRCKYYRAKLSKTGRSNVARDWNLPRAGILAGFPGGWLAQSRKNACRCPHSRQVGAPAAVINPRSLRASWAVVVQNTQEEQGAHATTMNVSLYPVDPEIARTQTNEEAPR